jgi:sterol desaturase/sphingolipid hydroxylase (fatty acid hydroxylase superfamily)
MSLAPENSIGMFSAAEITDRTWNSLVQIVAPESQLYWLFLLSAFGITFLIYCLSQRGNENVNLKGFLAFCFPRKVYAHPSAHLDLKYFVVNTILYGAFIAPLLVTSSATALGTVSLLVTLFGVPVALLSGGIWSDLGVTVAAVVVADIAFFVSHYLQHRIHFLWEFHKVHHAAEVLQPLTLYRRHPVDGALDLTLMGGGAGLVLGISAYAFDESVEGVTILGTNAVLFLFHFAGVHLRHSHVRLSYGPVLNRIFICPTLHQIHHGCSPEHLDKNFGGIFSVWDWLVGTLYIPRDDEEVLLGLPGGEHSDYNSIISLYLRPFVKNTLGLKRFVSRILLERSKLDV